MSAALALDLESAATDLAARTWMFRAGAEAEAASRFERLTERLVRLQATREVIDLARTAAEDERRHLTRCLALAARFGLEAPAPGAVPLQEVGVPGLSAREQVLYELVASCCITETLSAAALLEMRDHAKSAQVADTVHEILRDEVRHSRLGWAHLAAEQRHGSGEMLATLLPSMLSATFSPELFDPDVIDGPAAAQAAGLGVLPASARRQVVVETLRGVVFPGLAHLGVEVDAAEHWLDAKLSAFAPASGVGPRPRPWARPTPACTLAE